MNNHDNPSSRSAAGGAEPFVVILPIIESTNTHELIALAAAIARHQDGTLMLVRVVVGPSEQALGDSIQEVRAARTHLDALAAQSVCDAPITTLVCVAHSVADGIRTAATEQHAGLIVLGWQIESSSSERLFGAPISDLLHVAPCDMVVVRLAESDGWRRILLPVRGGPHTPLAAEITLALADLHGAQITMLYASDPRLPDDEEARTSLQSLRSLPRITRWLERRLPAEQAILAEAPEHQALVMGMTGRHGDVEAPVGPLVDRILRRTSSTVVLVHHHMAPGEEQAQRLWQRRRDLSAAVDRWFAENTFSSDEFADLGRLVALKQQRGFTISLGLPALNEEATIGPIIRLVQQALIEEVPLLDELVAIDSGSDDRTREIARSCGVPVHIHQEILPQYGAFAGKGEALWKSLYVLNGDIVAWIDTDIQNFHPRFVYGILGPLLREPRLVYSKGFYQRPIQDGLSLAKTGGGRVTELVARPLLNLFYPGLSGVLQPLAGEYAARRDAIEWAPFFTGYGVETGLLIDLLQQQGLRTLAQVDLQQRVHRNQELTPLSKMAFAIIQVVIARLEQRQRVQLLEPVNTSMKLIQQIESGGFQLELREIRDHERPPMATIPEYRRRRGLPAPLPALERDNRAGEWMQPHIPT